MAKTPADFNKVQFLRDLLFAPKGYYLNDKFVLRDGKKHPVAIVCPGGAYQMVCSYIEGVPVAKKLNERGWSVYIVYYRTRALAHFPAPQEDLAQAIRDVCARKEKDNHKDGSYTLWGFSAGGHLAASVCTEKMVEKYRLQKPTSLVLGYPVISMRNGLTHQLTHDTLLGQSAASDEEGAASIDELITPDFPPTYIWCGEADTDVSPENTRRMAAALENANVRCTCEIFPEVGHGVGPGTGTSAEGWIDHAIQFAAEQ